MYASVNSPHHVGFGEGLFLTALFCVGARQLCSVEFFSVYIDRMILHQLQNHKCLLSRGNVDMLMSDRTWKSIHFFLLLKESVWRITFRILEAKTP